MVEHRQSSNAAGYQQESLHQAIYAVAYRQIVAFLALTLAFSAPLSCQQHGMMSLLDMHDHTTGHGNDSPCSFHDHQSTPGMALSTFAGISPTIPALALLQFVMPLPAETPSPMAQLDQEPPDQPPRAL